MGFLEVQYGVLGLIRLVLVLVAAFVFVDALTRPAQAFPAVDKMTKAAWLWLTGLSLVCLLVFDLPGLFSLLAVVAVFVYLLDVRPAVTTVTRRRP